MKLGCLYAAIFAIGSLILFALLAPLLFRGMDMEALGQAAAPLLLIVFGTLGFVLGYLKQTRKSAN